MSRPSRRLVAATLALGAGAPRALAKARPAAKSAAPPPPPPAPPVFATEAEVADIRDGIRLYYVTAGLGAPVIFVHGSLSDYSYWQGQLAPFAAKYRVIAYSRRYDWPNENPARRGYSAALDAEDLAWFIDGLNLGSAHIVGHSYGALTALFLAARHPQLVRTVTLAEPPAMSLLAHLPGDLGPQGAAMLRDVQKNMVAPMKRAFAKHDTEGGVQVFMDYVKGQGTWDAFSAADKAATLKDAHEWEVIFAGGELFPEIKPAEVAAIKAPVLMLSGAKSYPFLGLIDEALYALIPQNKHIIFPDATHQMWLEHPTECREAVFALIDGKG
jgi:pimeloyl-ACP methyl ester carboxylesterase